MLGPVALYLKLVALTENFDDDADDDVEETEIDGAIFPRRYTATFAGHNYEAEGYVTVSFDRESLAQQLRRSRSVELVFTEPS